MDYYDAEEFEKVLRLLNADDDGSSLESSLDSLQQHLTTLNQHFALKLIETPNVSADHLIRFFKWARNKKDTYYFTIAALCCSGSNESDARSVCQKMLDLECLPDDADRVVRILGGCCLRRMPKEAYSVFLAAKQKWKQLPIFSFELLVMTLCGKKETVQLALEILNDIPEDKEGMKIARMLYANVVRALCRFEYFDAAKQLILKMIAHGPPPYDVLFDYVIEGYAKAGKLGQAMEMAKLMESRGFKPNSNTRALLVEEARKILE